MSSKTKGKRRDHFERPPGFSGQRISRASNRLAAVAVADDDLIRLIRLIARQAALEAFALLRDARDSPRVNDPTLSNRLHLEHGQEGHTGKESGPPEPGECFLSVAEVAKRLDLSEKTVRRKIASGDLPAHRVVKLVRVGEHSLTDYITQARSRRE